jgi:hypothetical protein
MTNWINRKRKGELRRMPKEMLQEFLGKECFITMFNAMGAIQGTVISIEDNWIKVEEKKKVRIINGDMIRDISLNK